MAKVPTEHQEQVELVRWLRVHGVLHCHVPNGGRRGRREAIRLKAAGVEAGVPDLLLFDPPPIGGSCGVALELKRRKGGRTSPKQERWLRELEARGWVALVCHGAEEAIQELERLGYGRVDTESD